MMQPEASAAMASMTAAIPGAAQLRLSPEELYRFDVNGYTVVENAIAPDLLERIDRRMDDYVEQARSLMDPVNPSVLIDSIVNYDDAALELVANPRILPYLDEMIENPRFKSVWVAIKFKGGYAFDRSNHTPSRTVNFYHFNGQIRCNLINVFYAIRDVSAEEGALHLLPGSHKANYPLPATGVEAMLTPVPLKAGSALVFSHDVTHQSLNSTEKVRRIIIFTYCPGIIANSYADNDIYDQIFARAPEGSWQKYLLRRPNGYMETYPRPVGRPYDAG